MLVGLHRRLFPSTVGGSSGAFRLLVDEAELFAFFLVIVAGFDRAFTVFFPASDTFFTTAVVLPPLGGCAVVSASSWLLSCTRFLPFEPLFVAISNCTMVDEIPTQILRCWNQFSAQAVDSNLAESVCSQSEVGAIDLYLFFKCAFRIVQQLYWCSCPCHMKFYLLLELPEHTKLSTATLAVTRAYRSAQDDISYMRQLQDCLL